MAARTSPFTFITYTDIISPCLFGATPNTAVQANFFKKQRMSQSSVSAATSKSEPVSSKGAREGNKECLPSSSHKTAANPNSKPWGTSGSENSENTGPRELRGTFKAWSQQAQPFASAHREALNSSTWDLWFSVIRSHLLFLLPAFCCKTPTFANFLLAPQSSFLRVTWDVTSQA